MIQIAPAVRSRRALWVATVLLILSTLLTFFFFRSLSGTQAASTNISLLTLIHINITCALILLLLLSRHLVKWYFERRQKQSSLRGKLIAAFLSLALVPTGLLFIVASGLLTNNVEQWFSAQAEKSLDHALSVAQGYYQEKQVQAARRAEQIARYASAQPEIFQGTALRAHASFGLPLPDEAVDWFDVDFERISKVVDRPISSDFLRRAASSTQAVTTIQSTPKEDFVRASTAVRVGGKVLAFVVVETRIPLTQKLHMEEIRKATETYKQLRTFKKPIQGSYVLSFAIIVMMILFAAIWFGFYLARRMTLPIQMLAEGTQSIAQGKLDVHIDVHATDEIGVLVESFNKMAADLRQSRNRLVQAEKIATWQEVARQIAHEIKNPLTPILLATERLRKKHAAHAADFDGVFDEATEIIMSEVHGLKTLVDAFAGFARMPHPELTLQAIGPMIEEVRKLYAASHPRVLIDLQMDAVLPPLLLDRDQIKRVFVNLFENAIDAMSAAGILEIVGRYNAPSGVVCIEVSDSGQGIAETDIEKVFLPYFSRKTTGTGLGLAIVHRIIVDHNARIRVSQRQPQGTTFTLEFPV